MGPTGTISSTIDGDLHITGKLTLDGDLDPPNVILSGPTPSIRTANAVPLNIEATESVFSGNTRVTGNLVVDGIGGTSGLQTVLQHDFIVIGPGETKTIYGTDLTKEGIAILQFSGSVSVGIPQNPSFTFSLFNGGSAEARTGNFRTLPPTPGSTILSVSFMLFLPVGGDPNFIELQCTNDGDGLIDVGHDSVQGNFITLIII